MTSRTIFHRLFWPSILLVSCLAPILYWDNMIRELGTEVISQTITIFRYTIAVSAWLALAWLVIRLMDIFFWDGLVAPRLGGKVPRLLKDVLATIIFLIAITGIIGVVFDMSITGLWATSGVVGLVVGLALQSMISDVFSGIAINIDRTFIIGDWIRIQQRGLDPFIGCVEEINWRSTKLKTTDNVRVIIPNNLISTIVVSNLTRPHVESRFDLLFTLDFEVPVDRALRILNAGVKASKGPLEDPAPKARVNGVNDWGVEYKVRYWLKPGEVSPNRGRHGVSSSILDHLHQAGLELARPKQDIYHADMPNRQLDENADRETLLRRIDIFEGLDPQEMNSLAANLERLQVQSDQSIVQTGAPGDSMYVLVEGLLYVYTTSEGSETELRVGQITPGEFFGEMSLLTGEPRSATVVAATDAIVYEIRKDDFTDLVTNRPSLAENMTRVVAQRRLKNDEAVSNEDNHESETPHAHIADQILDKMLGFFGIRKA